MMKFFTKWKFDPKQFFTIFIIILIPNILRQIVYFVASNKTGSIDFIASFETRVIFTTFPFLGIVEEIILGLIFVAIWFYVKHGKFLAYGWVFDSLFDFISVIAWFFIGVTPLQALGLGAVTRFALREIVFSYVIAGPLLYKLKPDIKKFSIAVTIFALIVLTILFI